MNLILLTAIRSGSTYLTRMLLDTGLVHRPPPYVPNDLLRRQMEMCEFLSPNKELDPWIVEDRPKTREGCIAHLRYRLSCIREPNLLLKILMEQYRYYLLDGSDRPLIESLIPSPVYIWLERRDIIARTVSAYTFFATKKDHIRTQKEYDEYINKKITIDDRGLLSVYRDHVARGDWGPFLGGCRYLKVEYEDLVAHPADTLGRCLDHIGIGRNLDLQEIVDKQPGFRTERPDNRELRRRLEKLLRKIF